MENIIIRLQGLGVLAASYPVLINGVNGGMTNAVLSLPTGMYTFEVVCLGVTPPNIQVYLIGTSAALPPEIVFKI